MSVFLPGNIRDISERYGNLVIAFILALSGFMPIVLFNRSADAAVLTTRSVTIGDSTPSATGISYKFDFTAPASTAIQSMVFQFCDEAIQQVGCTKPTGINVGYATATVSATGQVFSEATLFTEYSGANAGGCNGQGSSGDNTATTYCVTRTDTDAETAAAKSITIDAITNPSIPSGNNKTIFVRIKTYSDTAFATAVDTGTVAASIVNQLTVTGRVQERLEFCVFALDDAAGSSGTIGAGSGNFPNNCAASEATASTSVDLGIVDHLTVATSPVDNNPPTAIGNDRFGAAMISTNAANGITLAYYAAAAGSGTNELRAFRVPGATCNASGTDLTDSCFVSGDDTADDAIVAGSEQFGVQIACIVNSDSTTSGIGTTSNLGKNGAGAYTGNGTGTGGAYNTIYDADQSDLDDDSTNHNCENDPGGTILTEEFSWRDSGTAQALVSSVKVVDREVVKLRYGAAASNTTPSGTYTVATVYIATPVF